MTKTSDKSKHYVELGTLAADSSAVPSSGIELGTRIAQLADALGTRKSAASTAGISVDSLQRYIRGENMPPLDVAGRLCLATGARMEWLVTGMPPQWASEAVKPSSGADSQPVRLDANRLASLIETVDSALRLTGRHLSAKGKAGVVAALYSAEAWRGTEAVTTALTAIINAIKEEADGQ